MGNWGAGAISLPLRGHDNPPLGGVSGAGKSAATRVWRPGDRFDTLTPFDFPSPYA